MVSKFFLKSPYYWSAFVYYGTLESKESTNFFLWISVGVGIVGLVFLFLFFRKRILIKIKI
jgi:hypothetical protein